MARIINKPIARYAGFDHPCDPDPRFRRNGSTWGYMLSLLRSLGAICGRSKLHRK